MEKIEKEQQANRLAEVSARLEEIEASESESKAIKILTGIGFT